MSVGVGVGVCVNEFPRELSRADSYVTFGVGVCVNEFPRELLTRLTNPSGKLNVFYSTVLT